MDVIIDLKFPKGLLTSKCGKYLFGCENHSIFRFEFETKQKYTICGKIDGNGFNNGNFSEALFDDPRCLIILNDFKTMYICDRLNHLIRSMDENGKVTTFAGCKSLSYDYKQKTKNGLMNGKKESALFCCPTAIVMSPDQKFMYVCDTMNHCIRIICMKSGIVETFINNNILFPNNMTIINGNDTNPILIVSSSNGLKAFNLNTGDIIHNHIVTKVRKKCRYYGKIGLCFSSWTNKLYIATEKSIITIYCDKISVLNVGLCGRTDLCILPNEKIIFVSSKYECKVRKLQICSIDITVFIKSCIFKYSKITNFIF
jgi:hypothetical protein